MAGKRPLRVYFGPHDSREIECAETEQQPEGVQISLSELLHNCADAARSNRAWIEDFREEQITVSRDLYEVILAYQHYRRDSA